MTVNPNPILVLYAEDNFLLQAYVEAELHLAAFEVVVVPDGEEAVGLIDARRDLISAFITDIDLGKGISGWIAARKARELVPDLPVVYVSGASSHEWAREGVPESIMIEKPFAAEQVVAAVSGLVSKRLSERANREATVENLTYAATTPSNCDMEGMPDASLTAEV